jgi:hypothetical protein
VKTSNLTCISRISDDRSLVGPECRSMAYMRGGKIISLVKPAVMAAFTRHVRSRLIGRDTSSGARKHGKFTHSLLQDSTPVATGYMKIIISLS